jgi:hypothetical protein
MYEYIIENIHTAELTSIFGYSAKRAFERAKLNPAEWIVLFADYID